MDGADLSAALQSRRSLEVVKESNRRPRYFPDEPTGNKARCADSPVERSRIATMNTRGESVSSCFPSFFLYLLERNTTGVVETRRVLLSDRILSKRGESYDSRIYERSWIGRRVHEA